MLDVARLPVEILLLIAAQCVRDELKALRLTNHAFLNAATEHLFREIHISPNSHSFDRAHSIVAQEHLRIHVVSLVYHYGMLQDVHPDFDTFRHQYFSTRNYGEAQRASEVTSDLIWSYKCFLEEMDGQRDFELRVESEELQHLCERLLHLDSISTILDEIRPFAQFEDYIGKRTGMAASGDYGEERLSKLIKATVNKPLRRISARSIQWHDLNFVREQPDEYWQFLRNLDYLELGIYNVLDYYEFEDDDDKDECLYFVDLLEVVLGKARNVEILKLDFDELPFDSHADKLLPISRTIFSNHWPQLRVLKLEAVCAAENELVVFLHAHKASLRELCLGDIELVKFEDKVPCILRTFESMRNSLQLTLCKLTGNFTNRVNQAWYVNTESTSSSCLSRQLELYLCPLSPNSPKNVPEATTAEVVGLRQKSERLDLWLHTVQEDYEDFQDDSWQWCPELLEDG